MAESKLTRQVIQAFREGLAKGMPSVFICRKLGLDRRSPWRWRKEAKKKDARPIYHDFCNAVDLGKAEFVERALDTIRAAAVRGDWKAASWGLERLLPEHFGNQ